MSGWDLPAGIVAYATFSLGGVAIVKFLNYYFCFSSWLILALLSRATWLLAIPFSFYLEGFYVFRISRRQLGIYLLVAIGLSIVESLNSISISVLAGSLYALIKGTDVVWSMILSRVVLQKKYSISQVGAVLVITLGISAVFCMGPPQTTRSHQAATEQAMQSAHIGKQWIAAVLCLVGAFCNSLLSIAAEAILKQILRNEQMRLNFKEQEVPSKLMLSNAYSMWTSLFSFLILSLSAVATGQLSQLPEQTKHFSCSTKDSGGGSNSAAPVNATPHILFFVLSLCFVTISRFAERLCKHWICVCDSAMTFSLVQASRRLAGVFILALIFGEDFPSSMLVGSLLAGAGFFWHTLSSMKVPDTNRTKQGENYELVSLTSLSKEFDGGSGKRSVPVGGTETGEERDHK